MKTSLPPGMEKLRERIKDAVQAGKALRQKVQEEVCAVLQGAELDAAGLERLTEEVLAGAREGFARVAPADRPTQLRQVVDGLADALEANAQALQSAVEEARARGRRFTEEELKRAGEQLETAGKLLRETLQSTTQATRAGLAAEAQDLAAHARQAWERTRPALARALAAVREDPKTLGRQAAEAGVTAAGEAAGALFIAVGRRLQRLGEQWRQGRDT